LSLDCQSRQRTNEEDKSQPKIQAFHSQSLALRKYLLQVVPASKIFSGDLITSRLQDAFFVVDGASLVLCNPGG